MVGPHIKYTSYDHPSVPREIENNAYTKYWRDKKGVLW